MQRECRLTDGLRSRVALPTNRPCCYTAPEFKDGAVNFESYFLIGLGILLAIVGIAAPRRVTKLKIRNFQGNLSTGDVSGEMHQTCTSTAPAPKEEQTRIGWRDVIGWVIALLGVALAGWNIYLAFFRN